MSKILLPTRRKLITGAAALGAYAALPKQVDATTVPTTFFGAPATTNPLATTWKNAVVTNGGTVSNARLALVSTLISNLQSAGVWSLLDRFWLMAGENSQSALTDLVANELASIVGSVTFSTNLGYKAGGVSGNYISTVFNFSTATHYAQNSAHLMAYVNSTSGDTNPSLGDSSTLAKARLYARFAGLAYTRLNNATQGGFSVATPLGCTIGTRTASTTTITYKNGSSIGTDSGASAAAPNDVLGLCGSPSGGDANNRYAAFSVGAGLTALQVSALNTYTLNILTAIGAN